MPGKRKAYDVARGGKLRRVTAAIPGLYAAQTTIPGLDGQYGLFTSVHVRKGTWLGPCGGSYVPSKYLAARVPVDLLEKINLYSIDLRGEDGTKWVLDPTDAEGDYTPRKHTIWASANEQDPTHRQNVSFREDDDVNPPALYFEALTDLEPGDELFVYYGAGYPRQYPIGVGRQ